MEVIADTLGVPIEDIGRRSFEIDDEPGAVSNVCTVFAKSEATALLKAGWSVNRVLAAYCAAMAERVAGLIERLGVEREFFITGGIAKNPGVVKRIEKLLGIKAMETKIDSQIAGALGAALRGRRARHWGRDEAARDGEPGTSARRTGLHPHPLSRCQRSYRPGALAGP